MLLVRRVPTPIVISLARDTSGQSHRDFPISDRKVGREKADATKLFAEYLDVQPFCARLLPFRLELPEFLDT
jgi:hypothetical protein